jgi:hypothetical protein
MVFPLERGNDAIGKNFFSKVLIFKPRSYTKSGVDLLGLTSQIND